MNDSFEMADFLAAIDSKDYIKLKNYIVNSIRNNPGFRKGGRTCSEATEAFRILRDRREELPGLFSKYELQSGEVEFNENDTSTWDEEYFIRQTFFLEENFCSKRFDHVKKIGLFLARGNFSDPQEENEKYENDSVSNITETKSHTDYKPLPISVIIVIVFMLAILLVGIVAKIKWLIIVDIISLIITIAIAVVSRKR